MTWSRCECQLVASHSLSSQHELGQTRPITQLSAKQDSVPLRLVATGLASHYPLQLRLFPCQIIRYGFSEIPELALAFRSLAGARSPSASHGSAPFYQPISDLLSSPLAPVLLPIHKHKGSWRPKRSTPGLADLVPLVATCKTLTITSGTSASRSQPCWENSTGSARRQNACYRQGPVLLRSVFGPDWFAHSCSRI